MLNQSFYDIRYDFVGKDLVKNVIKDVQIIKDENCFAQIILFRLLIPRGQYLLNPEVGSDLYQLKRSKKSEISDRMIENIIRDALEPEFEAGNIDDIEVFLDKNTSLDGIIINLKVNLVGGDPLEVNLLLNI